MLLGIVRRIVIRAVYRGHFYCVVFPSFLSNRDRRCFSPLRFSPISRMEFGGRCGRSNFGASFLPGFFGPSLGLKIPSEKDVYGGTSMILGFGRETVISVIFVDLAFGRVVSATWSGAGSTHRFSHLSSSFALKSSVLRPPNSGSELRAHFSLREKCA